MTANVLRDGAIIDPAAGSRPASPERQAHRHCAGLRIRECPLGRPCPGTGRSPRDPQRQARGCAQRRRPRGPWRRCLRNRHAGTQSRRRRPHDRPPRRRRPARTRHLRRPPGPVRSRCRTRHRSRGHGGVARQGGVAAGQRRPPHGLEHGVRPEGPSSSRASRTSASTSCTPTASRSGISTSSSPAWRRPWSRGPNTAHPSSPPWRTAFVRHPVPPREVRRRRRPAAAQLGGQLAAQACRPSPRRLRPRTGRLDVVRDPDGAGRTARWRGLSFRQQKSPRWVQIVFYVLAGMSLLAAYPDAARLLAVDCATPDRTPPEKPRILR